MAKQAPLTEDAGKEPWPGTSRYRLRDELPISKGHPGPKTSPLRELGKLSLKGCRAVVAMDNLYVKGQLFCDHERTSWLF